MITPELRHIKLVVANDDKRQTIRQLHELGELHIASTEPHDGFTTDTSLDEAQEVSDLLLSYQYIERVTEASLTTSIDSLPPFKRSVREARRFIDAHRPGVEELAEQKNHHNDRIDAYKEQLSTLDELPDEFHDVQQPIIFKGDKAINDVAVDHHVKHGGEHYYAITGDGIEKAQKTQQLTQKDLRRVDLSYVSNTIRETQQRLHEELKHHEEQRDDKIKELRAKGQALQPKLSYTHTVLKAHYDELTLPNKFQANDDLTIIEAYCEPGVLDTLPEHIPEATILDEEPDEAPTKLKEHGFNQSFQTITSMFDTPKYGAFDPTGYVTFFYPLFFGFMLSDIGYGLLTLLTALVVQQTINNSDDYANILAISGVATILFGILFGSFFGELIPLEPLWTAQFEASFNILILSLIIGLIHMNIGVLTNLYQRIKQNKPPANIIKHAAPLPLVQASTAALYYQHTVVGITGLIAATALLTWRDGFIGVLGLSDYLGTWFSYARLLALSLATAGIALAVNIIAAQLSATPIIGSLIYTITLIAGHTFNYAVNLIGTTINAARLHYVEFFDLFFQGGGTPFNAFNLP
jgi:V/A-type H+-transporting ATPase subunit I